MVRQDVPRSRGTTIFFVSLFAHAWLVIVLFVALEHAAPAPFTSEYVETEVSPDLLPVQLSIEPETIVPIRVPKLPDPPIAPVAPAQNAQNNTVPAPVNPAPAAATTNTNFPGGTNPAPATTPMSGASGAPGPSGTQRPLHQPARSGQSIVYVLDRSASMGEQGRFEMARRYLITTLRTLPAGVRVQVVLYNRHAETLFTAEELADWSADRLELAVAKLQQVDAEGTSSHVAGLKVALRSQPDAVFLLTDADELTDAEVRQIAAWNRGRTTIHTVQFTAPGVAPIARSPLQRLARDHHGSSQVIAVPIAH